MSRFALALALSLIAVVAHAQTDPRTNSGGTPSNPAQEHVIGTGRNARVTERVLVGEHAPAFELTDAASRPFRLRDARGQWTALFFTDRREDLPRLATLAATLDSLHVRTLAVTPEKVGALAAWRDAVNGPLLVLADERGDISALYGVWDDARAATRQGFFLLDASGTVRLVLIGQKVGAPSLAGLVQSAVEGL
jgi:peroxiredoxin